MGKSSVYREFATKDELVVAWLHRSRAGWFAATQAAMAHHVGDPARQLLAIVETVQAEIDDDGFRGCRFLNTNTEFPDPAHPAHREAVAHLEDIRQQLAEVARRTEADDAERLADELMLIIDGMYANAGVLGKAGPAQLGLSMAADLIASRMRSL